MTLSNIFKKNTLFEIISEFLLTEYGLKVTSANIDIITKFILENQDLSSLSISELYKTLKKNLKFFMLNNETYFFRHKTQIDCILDYMKYAQNFKVNILSFGCSSGEECYSLAIEFFLNNINNYEIIGIDIDDEALAQAKKGIYNIRSFRKFPEPYYSFFTKKNNNYIIKPFLKEKIKFLNINLIKEDISNYFENNYFNIILINNVLIYIDKRFIKIILEQLNKVLNENGKVFTTVEEYNLILESNIFIEDNSYDNAFKKKNLEDLIKKEFRELYELTPILKNPESEQIYAFAKQYDNLNEQTLINLLQNENIPEKICALYYSLFKKTFNPEFLKTFINKLIAFGYQYEAKKWLKTYILLINPTENDINDYIELCIKAKDYEEAVKMLEKKVSLFGKKEDIEKLNVIKHGEK
ncbi:methyltransferase domain-containing protein [Deferribacter autotrophicus]|uniref:Methyltransferase domain-containing protein n=1 Tax=Deferribacter autotrophicus TaxID=500465 RepID=A0A5A8F5Z2_9BACT|nr:CheR family methyltransferase [Deferribacter autotrophicus]KAA0259155.1 methyltransferase domain-containing protein [Deferribacter autotrophicus]